MTNIDLLAVLKDRDFQKDLGRKICEAIGSLVVAPRGQGDIVITRIGFSDPLVKFDITSRILDDRMVQ